VGYNIGNVGPAADVLTQAYDVRLGAVGLLATALFVTHLVMQIPGGARRPVRARLLGICALAIIAVGNLLA
jgi:hypothetical protein